MKESGDNERPEKELEVVWPCDEKRGALSLLLISPRVCVCVCVCQCVCKI